MAAKLRSLECISREFLYRINRLERICEFVLWRELLKIRIYGAGSGLTGICTCLCSFLQNTLSFHILRIQLGFRFSLHCVGETNVLLWDVVGCSRFRGLDVASYFEIGRITPPKMACQ